VRVEEVTPGSNIRACTWSPDANEGKGGEKRRSLGHRDRRRARQYAEDEAEELASGGARQSAPIEPTVEPVFACYREHMSPQKSPRVQQDDKHQAELWTKHLGPTFDLRNLSVIEWDGFAQRRRSDGVGNRTIQRSFGWLRSVCDWAVTARVHGRRVLTEDPTVEFKRRIPIEKNSNRPIADEERTETLRQLFHDAQHLRHRVANGDELSDEETAVHNALQMRVTRHGRRERRANYLPEVLEIIIESGRRISAVRQLRFEDLRLDPLPATAPWGKIQFAGEVDKEGKAWAWPMTPEALAAVEDALVKRDEVGPGWLFPAPGNPAKPLRKEAVTDWLHAVERACGLAPQKRGAFHPYRRRWATVRKHFPAQDVAQAGGWSSAATVRDIYQLADEETTLRAVFYKRERCEGCAGVLSPDPAVRFCGGCGLEIHRVGDRREA
jgi:integrase